MEVLCDKLPTRNNLVKRDMVLESNLCVGVDEKMINNIFFQM